MANLKTKKRSQEMQPIRSAASKAPQSEYERQLIALGVSPARASFYDALSRGEVDGDAEIDFSKINVAKHIQSSR